MKYTEKQEQLLKIFEKYPDDAKQYIISLIRELWMCYECLEDKEKLALIRNHFSGKSSEYRHLHELFYEYEFYKRFNKKTEEKLK